MEEKKVVRYKLVRHKWPDEIAAQKAKRNHNLLFICCCIVCFIGGILSAQLLPVVAGTDAKDMDKFSQVYDALDNKWYFGKDIEDLDNKLMNLAISGMADGSGDAHTTYMDAETASNFTTSLEGNFVGIGVQYYAMNENTFVIDRVFKNSPADQAGIVKGDQLSKINGESCDGLTLDQIAEKIKGDAGSKVSLEIIREGKPINLEVVRGEVNNSVFGEVENGVGVLEISSFAETSGTETGMYLKDFKDKGVSKLVIDLRDNGGGYLKAAVDIASYLMPKDSVIFKEEERNGKIQEFIATGTSDKYEFDKIVILVNNSTASASEVLASALQEQLNAEIVGVLTYGKGTVQVTLPFSDGSSLKYTTAQWLTSKDNKINGVGIAPNHIIELDPAITTGAPSLEEGESYAGDTVSKVAKPVQMYLKFLGYKVDRTDEYFSLTSAEALRSYQKDNGLEVTGVIDDKTMSALLSSCSIYWHDNQASLDLQKMKAMEVVNGK